MSGLFQVILDNPFLLIILIGGLISVFSRMAQSSQQKEGEEEAGGPQNQPQRQRPVQTESRQRSGSEIKWEDYFPTESTAPTENMPQPSSPENNSENKVIQKQQELYERHKKAREKTRELQQSLEIGSIADYNGTGRGEQTGPKDGLDLNFKELSGKEAMRAVVWSEVLGPPKGRVRSGSYRSNRR